MTSRQSTKGASSAAKAAGCKSLKEISDMVGVHQETIGNWYVTHRFLFDIVIYACADISKKENQLNAK